MQYTPTPSWVFTLDKAYNGGSLACSLDSGTTWISPEGHEHVGVENFDSDPIGVDAGGSDWQRLFVDEIGGALAILASATELHVAALPSEATCEPGSLQFHTAYTAGEGGGELLASAAFFEPGGKRVLVGVGQGVLYADRLTSSSSFVLLEQTGIPQGQSILSFAAGRRKDGSLVLHAVTVNSADLTHSLLFERNQGLRKARGVFRATIARVSGGGVPPQLQWASVADGLPEFATAGGTLGANVVACAAVDGDTVYLSGSDTRTGNPAIFKSVGGSPWQSVFGAAGNTNMSVEPPIASAARYCPQHCCHCRCCSPQCDWVRG